MDTRVKFYEKRLIGLLSKVIVEHTQIERQTDRKCQMVELKPRTRFAYSISKELK